MSQDYERETLTADQAGLLPGRQVLDFGTNWCGYCNAARPLVDAVLASDAGIGHIRIEDGQGRPLGRHYRVKLWPTLIFLRDGKEVARLVRPQSQAELTQALQQLTGAPGE